MLHISFYSPRSGFLTVAVNPHNNVKVEANAIDEETSIVKACLIEMVNRYQAHEFEEMDKEYDLEVEVAMNNKMKAREKCVETTSRLFQDAWEMVEQNISVGGERAIT